MPPPSCGRARTIPRGSCWLSSSPPRWSGTRCSAATRAGTGGGRVGSGTPSRITPTRSPTRLWRTIPSTRSAAPARWRPSSTRGCGGRAPGRGSPSSPPPRPRWPHWPRWPPRALPPPEPPRRRGGWGVGGVAWPRPQQIRTDSAGFCRDCADALGWMLGADLDAEAVEREWHRLLRPDGAGRRAARPAPDDPVSTVGCPGNGVVESDGRPGSGPIRAGSRAPRRRTTAEPRKGAEGT